jgi:hypothetical protein
MTSLQTSIHKRVNCFPATLHNHPTLYTNFQILRASLNPTSPPPPKKTSNGAQLQLDNENIWTSINYSKLLNVNKISFRICYYEYQLNSTLNIIYKIYCIQYLKQDWLTFTTCAQWDSFTKNTFFCIHGCWIAQTHQNLKIIFLWSQYFPILHIWQGRETMHTTANRLKKKKQGSYWI